MNLPESISSVGHETPDRACEESGTPDTSGKGKLGGSVTWRLVVVLLAVAFGTNFQFYTNSVINNMATVCQNWINESYNLHYGTPVKDASTMNLIWSFSTAALQVGAICGSCSTKLLADKLGRREALIVSSILSSAGAIIGGLSKVSNCFELFIASRFIIGMALGMSIGIASMFISEIAPVRYRGACGSVQQLLLGFGNMTAFVLTLRDLLGTVELWPVAIVVPPLLGSVTQFLVLVFFAYDSPRYLVLSAGRNDKGLKALEFYQGKTGAELRLWAVEEEQRALQNPRSSKMEFRFIDLFTTPSLLKAFATGAMVIFGVQMSGIGAVMAFSKTMYMQSGLHDYTSQLASAGLGLCSFVSPLMTTFLAERAGRKCLLIFGLCVCLVSLLVMTLCILGVQKFGWPTAAVGTIPCLYIFQMGFAVSSSIAFIAPAELFTQASRASAISALSCLSWVLQAICVFGFLPFSTWVGVSYSYIPFIVCLMVSIILLSIFLPETKGKTVEEIAVLFQSSKSCKRVSEKNISL